MNSKIVIVLAIFACVALTTGKHDKAEMEKKLMCKGEKMNFTQFTHWKPCEEKVKKNGGDQEEEGGDDKKKKWGKMIEIKVCMWEKMEVLKDGTIDEAKFGESLEGLYAGDVGTGLAKAVKDAKCYEPNLATNLKTDNHCESFHGFLKCIMHATHGYCHATDGVKEDE